MSVESCSFHMQPRSRRYKGAIKLPHDRHSNSDTWRDTNLVVHPRLSPSRRQKSPDIESRRWLNLSQQSKIRCPLVDRCSCDTGALDAFNNVSLTQLTKIMLIS